MNKNILNKIIIIVGLILVITPFNLVDAQTMNPAGCYKLDAQNNFTKVEKSISACQGKEGTDEYIWFPDPWFQDTSVTVTPEEKKYKLLAPLPGMEENFLISSEDNTALGDYLNVMFGIFIGICAVLAVIMIVMGGIEYMTSELAHSKEHGKERITHAILGLILALGAYTLLNTINPDLLKTDLKSLETVTVMVDLGGEGTTPLDTVKTPAELQNIGIDCPKSGGATAVSGIAQSYIGRSIYSREKRNTTSGGKAYIDCSSYVSQVYNCAGLPNPGGTTAGIFNSGTPVVNISADGTMINNTALKIGDLLGWKQGENGEKWGHVVMYVGNGQVIDAQGQGGVAVRSLNSSQFQGRIKYIKKI